MVCRVRLEGSLTDPFAGVARRRPPLLVATVASSSAGATLGCFLACAAPRCSPPPRHAGGVPSATQPLARQTCPSGTFSFSVCCSGRLLPTPPATSVPCWVVDVTPPAKLSAPVHCLVHCL